MNPFRASVDTLSRQQDAQMDVGRRRHRMIAKKVVVMSLAQEF
jgi:hypothetical protein